jgi:hypothetical protein
MLQQVELRAEQHPPCRFPQHVLHGLDRPDPKPVVILGRGQQWASGAFLKPDTDFVILCPQLFGRLSFGAKLGDLVAEAHQFVELCLRERL